VDLSGAVMDVGIMSGPSLVIRLSHESYLTASAETLFGNQAVRNNERHVPIKPINRQP